jgi:phosphatidylserine/phosphatidylglycerophosphate/cardiolipin synthase-like enzyme
MCPLVLVTCAASTPSFFLSDERNPVEMMREAIDGAEDSIQLVVYKFDEGGTAKRVASALKRGVEVRIVADASQASRERSRIKGLKKAGAKVALWKGGKLHAKFAIIDGKQVISGSFNLTDSAENENVELSVIIEEAGAVKRFQQMFEQLWDTAGGKKKAGASRQQEPVSAWSPESPGAWTGEGSRHVAG